MFIALSRFTMRNENSPEVREAFRSRPHLVDHAVELGADGWGADATAATVTALQLAANLPAA